MRPLQNATLLLVLAYAAEGLGKVLDVGVDKHAGNTPDLRAAAAALMGTGFYNLSANSTEVVQPKMTWVHSYARSGASTVLHLAAVDTEGHRTFSPFEVCHAKDDLDPKLKRKGCSGVIKKLIRCDFRGMKSFDGWRDPRRKVRGYAWDYEVDRASSACSTADRMLFKTTKRWYGDTQIKGPKLKLLEKNPHVQMLNVVRDPRGIFASWLNTFPLNDTRFGGIHRDIVAMTSICNDMYANMKLKHPQVHHVVLEDLIKKPKEVTQSIAEFLGFNVTEKHHNWLKQNINAPNCPGVNFWVAAYSICHTNSDEPLTRWQKKLTPFEQEMFLKHPQCRRVAEHYGFPLETETASTLV